MRLLLAALLAGAPAAPAAAQDSAADRVKALLGDPFGTKKDAGGSVARGGGANGGASKVRLTAAPHTRGPDAADSAPPSPGAPDAKESGGLSTSVKVAAGAFVAGAVIAGVATGGLAAAGLGVAIVGGGYLIYKTVQYVRSPDSPFGKLNGALSGAGGR